MGNAVISRSSSLEKFFPNFRHEDWVEVQADQQESTNRFGDLKTLHNKITKQQIDRYELTFYSDREQRIYEQCFMQRLRQEYLVNAFHYEPLKNSSMCSTVRGAIVYIQHIPIRLSDVTDIPFDESLYILKTSLLGFEKLYNESGYFQVMEEHVGIDKEGHVKVWLNADLSKNYPYTFEDEAHQSKDYQKIMVAEIITLIEKNTNFEGNQTSNSRFGFVPISVFMEKNNNRHVSFREVQQVIKQYLTRYNIRLPKRCSSVVEIFQEQYGQDFNVTSASDFMDNLDVGENFQELEHPTNQREQTVNVMSSRTKNELRLNQNEAEGKPASHLGASQNQIHLEGGEASYKEYQPISIYKPNVRNSRMSASASSHQGRMPDNLKLRSHKSSIVGSHHNSNRNSEREKLYIMKTDRSNQKFEQSYHNGGLYDEPSSQSEQFYDQIGNDLNRLYGDDMRMNQQLRQSYANSNASHHNHNHSNSKSNSNKQSPARPSQSSGSLHSYRDRLKIINTSRSSNQLNAQMRGSKLSESNISVGGSRGNLPKITFSYGQAAANMAKKGQNISEKELRRGGKDDDADYDRKIQEQFFRDVEQQLRKQEMAEEMKKNSAFSKKLGSFPDKIYQCDNEQQVDAEIMQDLARFAEDGEMAY